MPESRFKYPRTRHLPWSPGVGDDDLSLLDTACFEGHEVVATEKLDGENTTLYPDALHARSIDGRSHPSRDWVKAFHATIGHLIPTGWRVCGENLYARHAIAYDNLPSYFFMFSIWDEHNRCLGWDESLEWAELIGLEVPRTRYRGTWDEARIRALDIDVETCEGYVVRRVEGFTYEAFGEHVAKSVREPHVQTDEHWMHGPVVPNRLAAQASADGETAP